MRQYFMLFYSWGFTRKSPRDLQEVPDSYAKQSCGLTQGSSGLLHEAVLGSKHLLAQNSSRLYSQQSFGCVQSMPRVLLKAILSTSTEQFLSLTEVVLRSKSKGLLQSWNLNSYHSDHDLWATIDPCPVLLGKIWHFKYNSNCHVHNHVQYDTP